LELAGASLNSPGFLSNEWGPRQLITRSANGALRLFPLQGEIQSLGIDKDRRVWCHAGARLEARLDGVMVAAIDSVEAVAIGGTVAYCRREEFEISVYLHDGRHERQLLRVTETWESVRLSLQNSHLAVILASPSGRDQISARILWLDLAGSRGDMVLNRLLPVGFNSGPGLAAVVAAAGDIYAAYEDGPCTRVWRLAPGCQPQPVSPEGFEVFDFALNPDGTQMAVIASETGASRHAFDRQLLLGQMGGGNKWWFRPALGGVHDMPRWRADGRLEILCGDTGRWHRSTLSPDDDRIIPRSPTRVSALGSGATALDFLRLPGPEHRRSGVILLPRLHQQFVAGAQALFFHHLLFSVARSLAEDGYTVVTLSGPGAVGRGRQRRDVDGSYIARLREGSEDVARAERSGLRICRRPGGEPRRRSDVALAWTGKRVFSCSVHGPEQIATRAD
jgi:hypothetical protein